jgi:hypothetical protein
VKAIRASWRPTLSWGKKGAALRSSIGIRFTATLISHRGFGVETGQSLPKATVAPARRRLANGY